MNSKEALKRLKQETAPATYMKDFDKRECCNAIEKDIEVLEILKKYIKVDKGVLNIPFIKLNIGVGCEMITEEEYKKIKEWLNG